MDADAHRILQNLRLVSEQRIARSSTPGLSDRVDAVKRYQHGRFQKTYADLLAQPRYAPAVRFFLEDLYGPRDFSLRDAQFVRVVPALARLFPRETLRTVVALSELHALSEGLDTAMGLCMQGNGPVDDDAYAAAWRLASTPEQRERQIQLMLQIGHALDAHTRQPLLRHALRVMRTPARAAGLSDLQRFLEAGFDTFRGLRGADHFLAIIALRERDLAAHLFDGRTTGDWSVAEGPSGQ